MYQDHKKYFASANTSVGFVSYFKEIFDPNTLEKIYILKGGPGTGKSSFLRYVSQTAEKAGMEVEYFVCSSDPKSLDGILIKDRAIAIIDGTSPHTTEPIYPGTVEDIIDLGAFWDSKKLYEHKKEIIGNIQEKKRYYNRAYRFLKAYGEIEGEIGRVGEKALLKEKMVQSVCRLCERIFKVGENFEVTVRLTDTINANGEEHLNTFVDESKSIFIVEDSVHSAHEYLKEVFLQAEKAKQKITVSYSPLFPEKIQELYFPDIACSFVIGERNYDNEDAEKYYHYINMKRFLDKEILRENKQKIRFGKQCSQMLLTGAVEALSEAKRIHSNLESRYITAMDFIKMTQFREEFTKKILF